MIDQEPAKVTVWITDTSGRAERLALVAPPADAITALSAWRAAGTPLLLVDDGGEAGSLHDRRSAVGGLTRTLEMRHPIGL